ncbi:MAG: hypothetical protein ACOCP8_00380 [archaeon]
MPNEKMLQEMEKQLKQLTIEKIINYRGSIINAKCYIEKVLVKKIWLFTLNKKKYIFEIIIDESKYIAKILSSENKIDVDLKCYDFRKLIDIFYYKEIKITYV